MPIHHHVIDPRGHTHKRVSQNRRYSHAVLYRTNNAALIEVAERIAKTNTAAAERYEKTANLNDQTLTTYCLYLEAVPDARTRYARYAKSSRQVASEYAALAAERRAIHGRGEQIETEWSCAGWCGRYDLAEKLAARHRKDADVLIIEARVKD